MTSMDMRGWLLYTWSSNTLLVSLITVKGINTITTCAGWWPLLSSLSHTHIGIIPGFTLHLMFQVIIILYKITATLLVHVLGKSNQSFLSKGNLYSSKAGYEKLSVAGTVLSLSSNPWGTVYTAQPSPKQKRKNLRDHKLCNPFFILQYTRH